MSCEISEGRAQKCKTVGGIKNIYFVNYRNNLENESGFGTVFTNVVNVTPKLVSYKWELRGSQSMVTVGEVSRDNGTSFYTSTGTFKFNEIGLWVASMLHRLSKGTPQVITEDFNGTFLIYGWEHGCDVSTTLNSGATMGDGQNSEITITSIEKEPPRNLFGEFMTVVEGV